MSNLDGKIALVTASTRGIGYCCVETLARRLTVYIAAPPQSGGRQAEGRRAQRPGYEGQDRIL